MEQEDEAMTLEELVPGLAMEGVESGAVVSVVAVARPASDDDLDHVAAQINATLAHLQKLIENVNQASSDKVSNRQAQ